MFIFGNRCRQLVKPKAYRREDGHLYRNTGSQYQNKIQHATVRRKAENETIILQRRWKVSLPDITLPQKSHPGVRGSPGSSPASNWPTLAPDSEGLRPRQREKSALPPGRRLFQTGQGCQDRAETPGVRRCGPRGSAGRQRGVVSPRFQLGLAEARERGLLSLLRPGPRRRGRPQGGTPSAAVSPRTPEGPCRIRVALASPSS